VSPLCAPTRHLQAYGSCLRLEWTLGRRVRMDSRGVMVDNLTPAQRSYTMARIRNKNTLPELVIRRSLHKLGLRFRIHDSSLPGCPDLVFRKSRVVVFIDGDYWHGWRFPRWKKKLAPYWKRKIERNRERDTSNFGKLRRRGWLVIRIWEHQIERDLEACVRLIVPAVRDRLRQDWGRCR